jgi:hypothetical protein
MSRVEPHERDTVAAGEVEHPHSRRRGLRPNDLHTDSRNGLQSLAAGDERRQQQIAERAVLEQQRLQHLTVEGDVAQRFRDRRGDEHRLPGEQIHLAEESRRAVLDDLVARGIGDRHLAVKDRDERARSPIR